MDYEDREMELGMKRLVLVARRCSGHSSVDPLPWNVCVMCGYSWSNNQGIIPLKCASCKSTRWNEDGLHGFTCVSCGHEWVSRSKSPLRCPSCSTKSWNRRVASREGPFRLSATALDILTGVHDPRMCMARLMEDCGLDKDDAMILCLHRDGVDPITIARSADVPYDRVFDTLSGSRIPSSDPPMVGKGADAS